MNTKQSQPNYQPYLNEGDVFLQVFNDWGKVKRTYWKVTGHRPPDGTNGKRSWMANPYWSYKVVKCNKNGKEFKHSNGFTCTIDDDLQGGVPHYADIMRGCSSYSVVKRGVAVGLKANIDHGLLVGKLKRRCDYLVARMASDQKEYNDLCYKLLELEHPELKAAD